MNNDNAHKILTEEDYAVSTGLILMTSYFREANEFAGKRLLLIGASYSAEDIALQCLKVLKEPFS